MPNGVSYATEECFFENPYAESARVECAATDESWVRYLGKFRSDGAEPKSVSKGQTQNSGHYLKD